MTGSLSPGTGEANTSATAKRPGAASARRGELTAELVLGLPVGRSGRVPGPLRALAAKVLRPRFGMTSGRSRASVSISTQAVICE
jgi:hypothetical protein